MERLSLPTYPRTRPHALEGASAGTRGGIDARTTDSLDLATATVETNDASRQKDGARLFRLSNGGVTETCTIRTIAAWALRIACAIVVATPPLASPAAQTASAEETYVWVQFAAEGLQARSATWGPTCPSAEIDGVPAAMTPRARPDAAFPVLICALDIPRTAMRAAVDGRPLPLPLPPARMNKLLVVGDTGCRLKLIYWQDCNSADGWPFPRLAATAATHSPDIVLHVGDYYYRENACPPLRASCAGSPHGDNWETWKADFFVPAAPLLARAPFVFVRGNHESCERGRRGWTRLLSPFPFEGDSACVAREPTYSIDLGGLTLLAMDVTSAEDRVSDPNLAPVFAKELAAAGTVTGPVWYAFHKPIFSTIRVTNGETVGDNKTLAESARAGFPANVQAILSGHLHTLQFTSYVEDYPAQFVIGHGGDALDKQVPARFDGLRIGSVTVERGRSIDGIFGFAEFERDESDWRVTDYDPDGKPLLRCRLTGRKLDCE